EQQEQENPSDMHKRQLANANFQWAKAKVKVDSLGDSTEQKFKRAIELYKQANEENDRDILKV
ncbi:unnamed protein product, partial [Rotaria magnacalcarata]